MHYPIAIYRYHTGDYEDALDEAGKLGLPDFLWTPLVYAAIYARLGRADKAREAVASLPELNPDFVNQPRSYIAAYVFSEDVIEQIVEGLRDAGMDLSHRPQSAE